MTSQQEEAAVTLGVELAAGCLARVQDRGMTPQQLKLAIEMFAAGTVAAMMHGAAAALPVAEQVANADVLLSAIAADALSVVEMYLRDWKETGTPCMWRVDPESFTQ